MGSNKVGLSVYKALLYVGAVVGVCMPEEVNNLW